MAREAGATRVIVVSCSPAISNPHIYGIDLADPTELVAYQRTTQQIAEHIKADAVIFQDIDDMAAACLEAAEGKSEIRDFEVGVFSGKYITEVPEGYFEHLSNLRGNKEKSALLVASSGPINVAAGVAPDTTSTTKAVLANPEYAEDINIHNLAV